MIVPFLTLISMATMCIFCFLSSFSTDAEQMTEPMGVHPSNWSHSIAVISFLSLVCCDNDLSQNKTLSITTSKQKKTGYVHHMLKCLIVLDRHYYSLEISFQSLHIFLFKYNLNRSTKTTVSTQLEFKPMTVRFMSLRCPF